MNDQAFVISLARAHARAANARAMLEKLPIRGEILSAVDGRELTQTQMDCVYRRELHQPRYPFELKRNEIGCFLSHRNAWKAIVDRNLDAALILEDDVTVDVDRMQTTIDDLRRLERPFGYVQFPVRPIPATAKRIGFSGDVCLRESRVTMLRTSGQWVTRQAAIQLLAATQRFDRPVDTTLQMHWLTGVRCVTLDPSCISDSGNQLGGSTIGESKRKRLTLAKVRREFDRALYRSRISRLSLKADHEVRDRAA